MNLPRGFCIGPIGTDEDRKLYPSAVQSVFKRSATVELEGGAIIEVSYKQP